jgi:hypothetical protein
MSGAAFCQKTGTTTAGSVAELELAQIRNREIRLTHVEQ